MTYRIVIRHNLDNNGLRRHNSRGPLFDALFEGKVIVTNSIEPGFDSARILHTMGLRGRLEVWDEALPYYRFHLDIEKGAGLTIQEGEGRLIARKFKPYTGETRLDGISAELGGNVAPPPQQRPTDSPPALAGLSGDEP